MEFDVASVKPDNTDARNSDTNFPLGPGDMYVANGGNLIATNFPLIVYINFAYKVTSNQTQAIQKQLPGWVMTERFDITAKTDKHDATKDEMRLMMRALLADRFKLAIHSEMQQVPVYGLVLAKPGTLGPKLRQHPADVACSTTPPTETASDTPKPSQSTFTAKDTAGFPTWCGGIVGFPPSEPGHLTLGSSNVGLGLLASTLPAAANLGRPVIDQTGLTGKYDFILDFLPDRNPAPGAAPSEGPGDLAGPSIGEALKQQLGLKLDSQRGPVDVWIVDHIEHPTAN
jgi:uncharacterized protein (TIGR03435 family)